MILQGGFKTNCIRRRQYLLFFYVPTGAPLGSTVLLRLTRLSGNALSLFSLLFPLSTKVYLRRTPKPSKENTLLFLNSLLDLFAGSNSLLFDGTCNTRSLLPTTPMVPIQISVSLCELGALVDEVAHEEEVVLGRHGEGVPHERRRVDAKRKGHVARNAASLARRRQLVSLGKDKATAQFIDDVVLNCCHMLCGLGGGLRMVLQERLYSQLRRLLCIYHCCHRDTEV